MRLIADPLPLMSVTQRFGENRNGLYKDNGLKGHTGIDLDAECGTPVRAGCAGTVAEVRDPQDPAQYKCVTVLTEADGKHYAVSYGHLSEISVREGQKVAQGDMLGKSGNSGDVFSGGKAVTPEQRAACGGGHLHLGVLPVEPVSDVLGRQLLLAGNMLPYRDPHGKFYAQLFPDNGYWGRIDPEPLMESSDIPEVTPEMFRALLHAVLKQPDAPDYGLLPEPAYLASRLVALCALEGMQVFVTEGYRSLARQDELYARGRTAPGSIVTNAKGGQSFHNWRVAFDVAFLKDGKATYEGDWGKVGAIGESLGLEWGGRWDAILDRPHFQYAGGYTLQDFINGKVDYGKFSRK